MVCLRLAALTERDYQTPPTVGILRPGGMRVICPMARLRLADATGG
jgi:hypothetical protein